MLIGMNRVEQSYPRRCGDIEVEESLHYIESCHTRLIGNEVVAYFLGGVLRLLPRHLEEGEHH